MIVCYYRNTDNKQKETHKRYRGEGRVIKRSTFACTCLRVSYVILSAAKECAKHVSKLLGIATPPSVVFVQPNELSSSNLVAELSVSNNGGMTLKINASIKPGTPIEFIVSHELRHAYQVEYANGHNDKVALKWKSEFSLPYTGTYEHNTLAIELDANAFASAIYSRFSGIQVDVVVDFILCNLPEDIRDRVINLAEAFLK